MQILAKMVEQIRSENPAVTSEELINIVREYLQIIILKSIYQSKFGRDISFMGGTCLRICYDLKRYSEDLDFSLDRKTAGYSFDNWNLLVNSEDYCVHRRESLEQRMEREEDSSKDLEKLMESYNAVILDLQKIIAQLAPPSGHPETPVALSAQRDVCMGWFPGRIEALWIQGKGLIADAYEVAYNDIAEHKDF